MFFDGSLMKTGAGAGLLFISPLRKHLRYVLRLHFPASNNVAEYEALVNGLCIAIELGVRRLDARGDSQLVIDQVMKNSHCRDPKMEAYCDEVRRLKDKFYGLELNHVARRYNETADELAKIASGRTTVPPDVFSRDLHQPSVKTDDTPEPEEASAQPEAPSPQPEAPSAAKGEALRVEEERNGVTPSRNWQTPYLQYLHRGELPLDRAEARRLARRAKSFVLLLLYIFILRDVTSKVMERYSDSKSLENVVFLPSRVQYENKGLHVGNGIRSTGGISGITDQGCSESKSIGALESECQRLVTAWFIEGKDERDTEEYKYAGVGTHLTTLSTIPTLT
jgi:ribonuclease HI